MTRALTAWLVARRRRNWSARLNAAYREHRAAVDRVHWLEDQIRAFDHEHAPAWSPTVEYRGGELVRMPDGRLVRVAGPGSPGYVVPSVGRRVEPDALALLGAMLADLAAPVTLALCAVVLSAYFGGYL